MKRFQITITADAPDDLFKQGEILTGAKPAMDALIAKLGELTKSTVAHETRVLPMRKTKVSAPLPSLPLPGPTPIEQAIERASPVEPQVGPDSVTLPPSTAHSRRHAAAAD